jgi:broad specificity phosphatase PhoE
LPPTRLLLIRHAHHDPAGRFLQHACTGLTEHGRAQARALGDRLAGNPTIVAPVLLASNARRAVETAEVVAGALGLPVAETTCDLCEMHPGAAEGLTPEEMAQRYGPSYQHVPGAEHFPDWLPGAVAALERIVCRHRGRTILAFTHNAVVKASFVAFGHAAPEETAAVRPANTAIAEWSSPTGDHSWRLVRRDDTDRMPPDPTHPTG